MVTTYPKLWKEFCTLTNLYNAYDKAKKGRTNRCYVAEFEKDERRNLITLFHEVYSGTYCPRPLKRFVLRDPKTRVISVSDFRDRIVHHMLINVLQPIFEPQFVYDSYANRINKGTTAAIKRAQAFIRKTTKNNKLRLRKNSSSVRGYCLKCDIKSYFDTIDHAILVGLIRKRVPDSRVLDLITVILKNHESKTCGQGMPLGNWTSQFFANVYLNKLDQYVKHELKAKHYIRYVDDFIIFSRDARELQQLKVVIDEFLQSKLMITLHPNKCSIIPLHRGVPFLGFRVFPYHVLVQRRNLRKLAKRTENHLTEFNANFILKEVVIDSFNGWCAYAMNADTHYLRSRLRVDLESSLAR